MSVKLPFNKSLDFTYGEVSRLSPLVRRVVANNPSAYTLYGTGTYLVGEEQIAVIDPGPADVAHIDAILAATNGQEITHILITHTHLDHSAGCKLLQQHTDAKTYALGKHGADRENDPNEFGADWSFVPDELLVDSQTINNSQWSLTAVHTPGHAANHLSFYFSQEDALFCGDVVMGWSSTIVSPPDGNMTDYMHTLALLLERNESIYYPTHGAPIDNPQPYVRLLHKHRLEREEQVIDCVRSGADRPVDMLGVIYKALDPSLHAAAMRSLLATVGHLHKEGRIVCDQATPDAESKFSL